MIRRPPRATQSRSSAASDVYKRQAQVHPFLSENLLFYRVHRSVDGSWNGSRAKFDWLQFPHHSTVRYEGRTIPVNCRVGDAATGEGLVGFPQRTAVGKRVEPEMKF